MHHNEVHSYWLGFELVGLSSKRNHAWRMFECQSYGILESTKM